MKRQLLALTLALSALLPVSSRADAEVSFQFFYDNLSPYGEWIEVGDYGNCWRPNDVDDDWSPYTDGYWAYTDAGWTWVSYEDFGDITYHYGRWVRADEVGWCWVPGYDWGPAWVSWRSDDDYIGWAPLPPEAHWRSSVGFSVWVDDYCDIGPAYYNFCPVVDFCAPVVRHVCVPRVSVWGIFGHTANITNICFNSYHNVPFCGGPNFAFISGRVRHPVPALKLVQNTTIINNNYTIINNRRVLKAPRNSVAGNTLNVFAPKIVKNTTNLIKPQVTKVVAKEKVRRGWDLGKDQNEVTKLREKVKNQSKGLNPDTAPAKPVQVTDLKPVPEKADLQAPSPVARPIRPKKDRDNDGIPDRKDKDVAVQPQPFQPGKEKPGRPDAGPGTGQPGEQPGDNRPGVAQERPKKGGKDAKPGGQTDAPVVGVTPDRPDAPDRPEKVRQGKPGKGGRPEVDNKPDRVATDPAVQPVQPVQPVQSVQPETLDKPERKGGGGIRKPFKEAQPGNRIADDKPPVRPAPEAPQREAAGDRGKVKKAQDDAAEEAALQQRKQIAEQQARREQAERIQRQNAARMEQQRENAQRVEQQRENSQRVERQRQAQDEQQQAAIAEARRQQVEAQRERAANQQAVEAQRQQQAQQQARQQQRAIEAQREQQAQRQYELQQQRQQQQQQLRQQRPQPQVQQRPQPQVQQRPQPQIQQRPQPQVQQFPQRQVPNQVIGGGGGRGQGKGEKLTPEEAQALRRQQRGY
jgi:hypothetical protein